MALAHEHSVTPTPEPITSLDHMNMQEVNAYYNFVPFMKQFPNSTFHWKKKSVQYKQPPFGSRKSSQTKKRKKSKRKDGT